MDRDNTTQTPEIDETTAPQTPIDPTIQALLDRITELEAAAASNATRTTSSAPREICKRNHDASNWKVTPKGVRYCVLCYRELRLEQAEKKLRELGRIN